jgi:hypothetical protein
MFLKNFEIDNNNCNKNLPPSENNVPTDNTSNTVPTDTTCLQSSSPAIPTNTTRLQSSSSPAIPTTITRSKSVIGSYK